MTRFPTGSRTCIAAIATAACLIFPAHGFAADATGARTRLVRVLPDHYLAGGKRFHDLDALEAWVTASGATALRLESCTSAANKALGAATARFRHMYLDLRVPASGQVACRDARIQQAGIARLEIAPAADDVRRYWESVSP